MEMSTKLNKYVNIDTEAEKRLNEEGEITAEVHLIKKNGAISAEMKGSLSDVISMQLNALIRTAKVDAKAEQAVMMGMTLAVVELASPGGLGNDKL